MIERIRRWMLKNTFGQKVASRAYGRVITPVFGRPCLIKQLPMRGGRLVEIDLIERCPWPEDINIDLVSFEKDGKPYHYVSCSADGPNPDAKTFHHGHIGYWPDLESREAMFQFAADLAWLIKQKTGFEPLIIVSREDREQHAGWCLGEDEIPDGYGYNKLLSEYA